MIANEIEAHMRPIHVLAILEGPMPPYVRLCADLLLAYNPEPYYSTR